VWMRNIIHYIVVGSIPGSVIGYGLFWYFREPEGLELMVLHPVESNHNHLRIGSERFDEMSVQNVLGEPVGREELKEITVNGRAGYEIIDYNYDENTATATWMGGASSDELRAYKKMVVYVQQRLSKHADEAIELRVNQQPIVREVASRVANHMIRVSEQARVPEGDLIDGVIDDVLTDYDVDDPLDAATKAGEVDMQSPVEEHADTLNAGEEA